MKKYIVFDKQEGFSFLCDEPSEVLKSVGCEENTWDQMLAICKDTYEIIEYTGNVKYILD
jgi:hypothetical protein